MPIKANVNLKRYLLSNDNKKDHSFPIFPSFANVHNYFSPLCILLARSCLNICHAVVTFSKGGSECNNSASSDL